MTTLEKIFLGVILFLVLLNIVLLLYWKFKQKYTRERFAFFSASMIIFLFLSTIVPTLNSNSMFSYFIQILNYALSLNLPDPEPSLLSQTVIVVLVGGIALFLWNIHKNWNGDISKRQHEEQKNQDPQSNLFKEASIVAFQHFLNTKQGLEVFVPEPEEDQEPLLRKVKEEDRAWHLQVSDLLPLISRQYKIDSEKDWYSEHKCYLSKYGKEEKNIGIYCSLNEPLRIVVSSGVSHITTGRDGSGRRTYS